MSHLTTPQPRRSARLAQHPTSPAPMATVFITDQEDDLLEEELEEEEEVTMSLTKPKKPRKPRQKKTIKLQPEVAPPTPTPSYSLRVLRSPVDRFSPAPPAMTSYSLRSASKQRVEVSSDEEDYSMGGGRATPPPTAAARKVVVVGRMGLSETRFRRGMEQKQYVSSTPFSAGSEDNNNNTTTTTTKSKQKRSNLDNSLETTTTTVTTCKTTPQDPQGVLFGGGVGQEDSVVAEEEEIVIVTETRTEPPPSPPLPWHSIGLMEIGLAGFFSCVGVLGYICYISDLCSC